MRNGSCFVALAMMALLLFSAGCITQKYLPAKASEQITGTQSFDLDQDGTADLYVYDFAPVKNGNLTLARQVAVAVHTSGAYSTFQNLTAVKLAEARGDLDQFDADQRLSFDGCAANAGLKQDCTVIPACTVLCSGSTKCKKLLDKYPLAVPAAMIDYVDARNELDGNLLDARNAVLGLGGASPDKKNEFLNKLKAAVASIADIYSNPFYERPETVLCSRPELDVTLLADSANDIGIYNTVVDGYSYYVTVSVSGPGSESATGMELLERLPASEISEGDISAQQKIDVTTNGSDRVIKWSTGKASDAGYLLSYRFVSSSSPGAILPSLVSPQLTLSMIDLGYLGFTDWLFGLLYIFTENFFMALGASLALTLVAVILLYNLIMLGYQVARSLIAREGVLSGIRRALGRTEMRWKTDFVLGAILLLAGYYISVFAVSSPSAPPTLAGAIDYFTNLALSVNAAVGLAGVGCVFLGIILLYSSIENKIKITVLEQAYGVAIKEEKDLFVTRAARLKDKLKELQSMLEEYSKEEFEVSQEYDVLASISPLRVDELAKKMTPRSRKVIDEDLSRVEAAIERLSERKKMADSSWQKWSETIGRMLSEQNEVFASSLITVPASLRTWALQRYARERGPEGIVFERDSIKRKQVTPELMLKSMIDQGLAVGAVVFRKDKLLMASMAEGSATVPSVLAFKLRNSLRALAKSLGQHEPASFATVGGKNVLVLMKAAGVESLLIIPREKFKDAVEDFKKKAGMLSEQ